MTSVRLTRRGLRPRTPGSRLRRALLLSMLALLTPPWSTTRAGGNGGSQASDGGVVDKVLEFFGFRRAKATALLRGGRRPSHTDVWTMGADGSKPARLTTGGGYAWPVLCADGSVVTIHGAGLRSIRPAAPPKDVAAPGIAGPPSELLACT